MPFNRKHILGLQDWEPPEINLVLERAKSFKEKFESGCPRLGASASELPHYGSKSLVTLFYEPSTRTRVSFEKAAKALGMNVVNIAADISSVKKGESLKDTALTLEALGMDIFVLRHPMSGAPYLLAEVVQGSVINAGDGMHEHPTQALLDFFTIKEHKGKIEGLKVLIIGDILHSRVARSNIWGLTKLGAQVALAGPPTLMPWGIERIGVEVHHNLDEVIKEADIIYLLRIQLERQKGGFFPSVGEYSELFGLNLERLRKCRPDVLIMHPGPMNRGIEISAEVADSPRAIIRDQVSNGIFVRMALLDLILESL